MSRFEEVLEALGEGFYGDELEEQRRRADPDDTGKLTRARFSEWYDEFTAAEPEDDDDEEIAEERESESACASAAPRFWTDSMFVSRAQMRARPLTVSRARA